MRWRKLWPPLFLWLVGMTAGQTADPENQVQDGKLIRFQLDSGTSASFSLSPPDDSSAAAARTYFVTLNICSHPKNAKFSTLPQQTLLSAIDPDDTGKILDTASTKYGFANLSRTVPRDSNDKGMRVTIDAPASEQDQRDAGWTFELGISTSEPLHLLDRTPLFSLQDTDNTSLLVTGPTFFPSLSQDKGGGDPGSQLWLIPTSVDDNGASDPLNQLSQSSCFISNSSNLIEASQIKASNTTRGTFTLSPQEGAIGIQKDQHKDGGQRTQFHVTDLDPGTNYTIWGSQNTSQSGVRLFKQQFAVTKSSDNCRLVFDLQGACSNVAYAIPSPPELSSPDVLDIYKQRLQTSLTNFNTTLHTFSCGIPDQGRFSSVRTCDDCYEAYENWLCGIVMPRCTDIPPNQQQSAQQNYSTHASVDQVVFSDAPIPDSVQPVIVRDHPGTSRTPQWSNAGLKNLSLPDDVSSPFPYAEVPPCGGVCHLVAASCPNLISWTCPIKGTIAASYGEAKLLEPNDIQGGNMPGPVGVEKWRSADRFGNVWCNSFEIEALLDVRANTAGRTGRSAGLAAGLWVLLLWQQALL